LVEGFTDKWFWSRLREIFSRPLCPFQRLCPVAAQLHQFRAPYQAMTAIGNQIGLSLAPLLQRRRPLLRASPVEDLAAGVEHTAVDSPGRKRRNLARGHGHHRLIQQGYPAGNLSLPDQGASLSLEAKRHQVPVAEALPDRGGLRVDLVCRTRVSVDRGP